MDTLLGLMPYLGRPSAWQLWHLLCLVRALDRLVCLLPCVLSLPSPTQTITYRPLLAPGYSYPVTLPEPHISFF